MAKTKTIRNKTDTKLSLKVPDYLDGEDRSIIAEIVMEFIDKRTRKGNNVYNRKWAGRAGKYSEAYAAIKGKKSPVDLALSEDMLDAMKYFKGKSKTGQITIGFTKGTKNEGKAEGNIQGTYGQDSPIPGKARPFLDILKKDLDKIIKDYVGEDEDG